MTAARRGASAPLDLALKRLWMLLDKPERPAPDDLSALRVRIERPVARIQELAREFADMSRAPGTEQLRLTELVEAGIRGSESERNGRIVVHIDDPLDGVIVGSRQRWILMFINLFRNSAQARAAAGSIWVSSQFEGDGRLNILVDDDGPGVPEELRDRIFEQGISARGGSGLGLYDARQTVVKSGGTLYYEPSPRGGARFRIQVQARRSS